MRRFGSLRRKADFARLRQRGRRKAGLHLTVYSADPAPHDPRALVGITIARPVGTAVTRNRLRRRILALLDERFAAGAPLERLLIVPRPSAAALSYAGLRDELRLGLP
ncbi:MAG: ribonuclease P protein component [Candidatus Eremiobacteraeota bacterium]|nr:ribonuclease P protein component [Candidatus Eremiobacteraeota bacterium]